MELGCFGLAHKSGGYFATIINSKDTSAVIHCLDIETLYQVVKALNPKNFDFVEKKWQEGYFKKTNYTDNALTHWSEAL